MRENDRCGNDRSRFHCSCSWSVKTTWVATLVGGQSAESKHISFLNCVCYCIYFEILSLFLLFYLFSHFWLLKACIINFSFIAVWNCVSILHFQNNLWYFKARFNKFLSFSIVVPAVLFWQFYMFMYEKFTRLNVQLTYHWWARWEILLLRLFSVMEKSGMLFGMSCHLQIYSITLGVSHPLICGTLNFEKGIFIKKSFQANAPHSLQNLLVFYQSYLFFDEHDVLETFKEWKMIPQIEDTSPNIWLG